jgi:long-chain acyl-CoA synthetase
MRTKRSVSSTTTNLDAEERGVLSWRNRRLTREQKIEVLREWVAGRTIPQVLRDRAQATPDEIAIRVREFGIYREVRWAELLNLVKRTFAGLRELGLEAGDRVAIMGDPCLEWFLTAHAVLSARATYFGVYTTCSPDEVDYQLSHTRARLFIAEDQEFVDKFLAVADRHPQVQQIIVFDTRGTFLYDDPRLMPFDELLELGEARLKERPGEYDESVALGNPEDLALFIFTSGTTGLPKAAVVSHRNYLLGGTVPFAALFPEILEREERIICHLPLAHAFETLFSLCTPLVTRQIVHIGEDPDWLGQTLYEVQPTMFHGVPRIWEKMGARMITEIERSSWVKRQAYRIAMAIGRSWLEHRHNGRKSLFWELAYQIARWLSFRHMLLKAGFSQCWLAITAGAAIPPAVQALWQIWGVNLCNLYGATEAAYMSMQQGPFPKPGNVGCPFFGVEMRLGPEGEIQVQGPGVIKGYLGGETVASPTEDGWLRTGDVGEFSHNGELCIVDRLKDIMITAGGKNIAPSVIENLVKASPYVSEAVLIAEGRKFPAMLIEINYETVSEWARRNGVVYTDFTSLATRPAVYKLIEEVVDDANRKLARVEQVKAFRIIPRELDPEYGDTTPTRKIKRAQFYNVFADLIEEIYAEAQKERERIQKEVEEVLS